MARTRYWMILILATMLVGSTGCMNGFLNDDDEPHACEYQREPAKKSFD